MLFHLTKFILEITVVTNCDSKPCLFKTDTLQEMKKCFFINETLCCQCWQAFLNTSFWLSKIDRPT